VFGGVLRTPILCCPIFFNYPDYPNYPGKEEKEKKKKKKEEGGREEEAACFQERLSLVKYTNAFNILHDFPLFIRHLAEKRRDRRRRRRSLRDRLEFLDPRQPGLDAQDGPPPLQCLRFHRPPRRFVQPDDLRFGEVALVGVNEAP